MADEIASPGGQPGALVREISTSAKYYQPGVYTGALQQADLPSFLSFYRDLTITADPAAAGLIPLSSIPGRGRNTKLFAVGILPPNMIIDESQLLDRSATIPVRSSSGASAEAIRQITTADDEELIIPRQLSTAGRDLIAKFEGNSLKAYRDSGGVLTIGIGHTGRDVSPGLVWTQEQVNSAFANDIARFEAAVSRSVTVPVTQGQYDAMVSLAFNIGASAFEESTLLKKLNAQDYEGASAQFAVWNKVKGKVSNNLSSRRAIERRVFDRPALVPDNPLPVGADTDSAQFVGYGSQNANTFRRGVARQVDLIQPKLVAAQRSYLMAAKAALQAMSNTPPLRLLVNPDTFSVKSQKIVSDGNWGRNGPIVEFWGDDQDKISGSGKVAAFYALDAHPRLGGGGPGLGRSVRNVSQSWQNFQSLYLLYRNNGGLYLSDLSQQDRDVLLTTVGSVYLFYDNILYIGCFDSFTMTEAADRPFSVEYSFEFTVRAAFLLEFAQDFNYGGAAAFKNSTLGAGLPAQSSTTTAESLADIASTGNSVVAANDVQSRVDAAANALLRAGAF